MTFDPSAGIAADWLSAALRDRILDGTYRPGAWLREAELQREFGVSNGPVREALQNAVADGLAERAPFRGVRVIDLSERGIVELFEVRCALLGFAAERAAQKTHAGVAESGAALKAAIAKSSGRGEARDASEPGDFSNWVFDVAGNARLAEAYQRPLMQSLLYVSIARKHGGDADALFPFVYRVIDAIVSGEPAAAHEAVRILTGQTLRYVRDAAQPTTPGKTFSQ